MILAVDKPVDNLWISLYCVDMPITNSPDEVLWLKFLLRMAMDMAGHFPCTSDKKERFDNQLNAWMWYISEDFTEKLHYADITEKQFDAALSFIQRCKENGDVVCLSTIFRHAAPRPSALKRAVA